MIRRRAQRTGLAVALIAGFAAAAPGDTIRVCAGDYAEGQITITTANLSFIGAQASVSAGVGGPRSGETASGESRLDGTLRLEKPFGVVDGVSFTSAGNAIYGTGTADGGSIVNNRFVGVAQKSITTYAVSSSARDLRIENNAVTGIKQRGLTLYGANVAVSGNSFDMPATSTGEGAVTLTNSSTGISIVGNTFSGPRTSIWVGGTAAAPAITGNKLLGTGNAVTRGAGTAISADANWWGTQDGPMVDGALDATRLQNTTVATWCIGADCAATVSEVRRPASPAPATDSAGLDALNLPDSSADFSGTDLDGLDPTAPLEGSILWDDSDSWVDVYAYSSPVYLGTFPVVNGRVQLSGVDISALEAGGHRLVFVGQTSGATKVAVFSVARSALAATGAQPLPLALSAVALLLLGAGAWRIARRAHMAQ